MDNGQEHNARAVWFESAREAVLKAEPLRPIAADEILVRGVVSMVSAGTEMTVYRGQVASPDEVAIPTRGGGFPFPIKYGYQIIGVVEDAGPETRYRVGQRIFACHPHQERFIMSAADVGSSGVLPSEFPLLFDVPDFVDNDRAAFCSNFSVAYNGLLEFPVRIGDCVVVSGLGAVGTFAAHLARRTAAKLVVVDPVPKRRERAAWLGADAAVHPDDATAAILEHSDHRGADIWFESSGAPGALQSALQGTGNEGVIVALGYYGANKVELRLAPEFLIRRPRIVPNTVTALPPGLQSRWTFQRRMDVVMQELARLDISRLISHRFPFDRAPEAYRLIDQNPASSLSVLLDYEPGK